MIQTFRKKFIGDKAFYKMVLLIVIPIIVQNGITNFVNLLDNIMVGRIGTEQMSGVSIANQLIYVYNLTIFGVVAAAGIFTAQFFGYGDHEGVRNTFRFKVLLGAIVTAMAVFVYLVWGEPLIQLYLNGESSSGNLHATLKYGQEYMRIMLIGLPAFMIVQAYSSTLRECGETVLPMIAGLVAVVVNLIFNYILIFGKFGFPELGIAGAAIATVLSRYIEVALIIIIIAVREAKYSYMIGAYRTFKIPVPLLKQMIIKGTPLMLNEAFWALGVAVQTQCFSLRGLEAVAALNIANTLANLFNVIYWAMGDSVAIIVGQQLGAGNMKKARDVDNKLIFFSTALSVVIGALLVCVAPLFPRIYNTTDQIKEIATALIIIAAVYMPMKAFLHTLYFTLRSGGKTVVTFLFDNGYTWGVAVPLSFVLSRYTSWGIVVVYAVVMGAEFFKSIIGVILVKRGTWLQNIVAVD